TVLRRGGVSRGVRGRRTESGAAVRSREACEGGVGEGSCDFRVRIPMPGGAESLNAGVAAGVVLYEAARRRA
ncbi:hypothetical protein ACH5A6_21715, partial [Streptomyces sp. NPDC018584]